MGAAELWALPPQPQHFLGTAAPGGRDKAQPLHQAQDWGQLWYEEMEDSLPCVPYPFLQEILSANCWQPL